MDLSDRLGGYQKPRDTLAGQVDTGRGVGGSEKLVDEVQKLEEGPKDQKILFWQWCYRRRELEAKRGGIPKLKPEISRSNYLSDISRGQPTSTTLAVVEEVNKRKPKGGVVRDWVPKSLQRRKGREGGGGENYRIVKRRVGIGKAINYQKTHWIQQRLECKRPRLW